MSDAKIVPMPPPDPEDGVLFAVGDDVFRVTASIEKVRPRDGRVVRIDGLPTEDPET